MADRLRETAGDTGSGEALSDAALERLRSSLPPGELWVFAYGSLMWSPEFEFVRSTSALLRGYHRAFCVRSVRYRGTPKQPGLVLGLDRGGSCRGVAFLIPARAVEAVTAQLWAREMPRSVYDPRLLPIEIDTGRVTALTFVSNRAHESYAGRSDQASMARIIASCCGERGPNVDYLANTVGHLEAMGIHEPRLRRLLEAVKALGNHPPPPL